MIGNWSTRYHLRSTLAGLQAYDWRPDPEPCAKVVAAMGPPCFIGINVGLAVNTLSAEQGVDERRRFKRRKIVSAFTQPDQFHRDTEFLLNAENNATLSRPVQLG